MGQVPSKGSIQARAGGSSDQGAMPELLTAQLEKRAKVVYGDTTKRNILLVGTSGRGKSATGNSVFGSDVFETSDSMDTDPDSIVCKTKSVNGLKITICDALTIQDERMLPTEAKADIEERLDKCFDACPDGFHLLICVFSYTNRVTPEENVAAEVLIDIFGAQFLTEQAIFVFTHGENFDLQRNSSGGPDFYTWYRNIQDPLFQQVSSNMHAFMIYNVQTEKMAPQRQKILKTIHNCRKCLRREQNGYFIIDVRANDSQDTRQQTQNSPAVENSNKTIRTNETNNIRGDKHGHKVNDGQTSGNHRKSQSFPSSHQQKIKRKSKSGEEKSPYHDQLDRRVLYTQSSDSHPSPNSSNAQNVTRWSGSHETTSNPRQQNELMMGIGGQLNDGQGTRYQKEFSSYPQNAKERSKSQGSVDKHTKQQGYTGEDRQLAHTTLPAQGSLSSQNRKKRSIKDTGWSDYQKQQNHMGANKLISHEKAQITSNDLNRMPGEYEAKNIPEDEYDFARNNENPDDGNDIRWTSSHQQDLKKLKTNDKTATDCREQLDLDVFSKGDTDWWPAANDQAQTSFNTRNLTREIGKLETSYLHPEPHGCRINDENPRDCQDTNHQKYSSFNSDSKRKGHNDTTKTNVTRADTATQATWCPSRTLTSTKEWSLILICNEERRGKKTRNALLGRRKQRETLTWKSSRIVTHSTVIKISDVSLTLMDGRLLLPGKKIDLKQLELMENVLQGSFKHFTDGFHALVFVLSLMDRLESKEAKAIDCLKGMMGENIIRDHCICLCPYGERFLQENLSVESWSEKLDESLKSLISESQNRVVVCNNSVRENRDESISCLISLMQKLEMPYTHKMFDDASSSRKKFISAKSSK